MSFASFGSAKPIKNQKPLARRSQSKIKNVLVFLLLLIPAFIQAQTTRSLNKVKIKVESAGIARQNTIVSFDISSYTAVPAGSQIVVKTVEGQICHSQTERCAETKKATLHWRIDGQMSENESRIFVIEIVAASETLPVMTVEKDRFGNLVLKKNNTNVLQYNTMSPRLPGGIDPAYRRNGYIHPAWSPAGNVLTNINPIDHWHHYGIWNPWTMIEYDGQIYDLWNIGDKKGTVRFDSLYRSTDGNIFSNILVRHRHVIFEPQPEQVTNHVWGIMRFTPKTEKIIMDELQNLRVWNGEEGTFLWDLNFTLYPSTDLPVILKEYRYAGLGWRATSDWTKENCEMMTSEGKSRQEIDGTNARWVYVTGMSSNGKSGILFMASPKNHNSPEPLRIWDETQNGGRGDAFINFAPTKNEDWILEPGKSYDFRYRLFVFDGDITPAKAESIWMDYANPVKVLVHR